MKLSNKGDEVKITFDGKEYIIPEGDFELKNEQCANYLLSKTKSWDLKISKISDEPKGDIKKINVIKPIEEEVVVKIDNSKVEEKKEEEPSELDKLEKSL